MKAGNYDVQRNVIGLRERLPLRNEKPPNQSQVGLDGLGAAAGGQDVRVEEGYLVNVTINAAQARLEGRLAPSFNRCVGVGVGEGGRRHVMRGSTSAPRLNLAGATTHTPAYQPTNKQ